MFKDNETGVIDLFAYHNEKRIQNVNLLSLPEIDMNKWYEEIDTNNEEFDLRIASDNFSNKNINNKKNNKI